MATRKQHKQAGGVRHLLFIFGDQLSQRLSALDGFSTEEDCIAMAELDDEATRPWCHKTRLAFFFSAMRHFRDQVQALGYRLEYHALTATPSRDKFRNFEQFFAASLKSLQPQRVIVTEPGDWLVLQTLEQVCAREGVLLEVRPDRHFYCTLQQFREWSQGKKSMLLEHFYRWMRKQHQVLLDEHGKPEGGDWNYDKDNRRNFGKAGPGPTVPLRRFAPDGLTQQVIDLVEQRFAGHPGQTAAFDYPVTPADAHLATIDFVENRLPHFGDYQDAMWTDTDFLNHSRLSAVLNVHLIDPQAVVAAAIAAYEAGHAPLNAVEGFVRQIIGWREFVRGIYWTQMPAYIEKNALKCTERDVPQAYWDGKSDMNCIQQAMQPVLQHAYAHHIQRLMVLGLYAQLLGVHPRKFHDWHMAMYADAIDWVSLPNTLGMSQYGDGGVVGTKPYCASGNYIDRMSNYCRGCRYDPKSAVGERACPVTIMYWDFLSRHEERFAKNGRMLFQIKNLQKKSADELRQIRAGAARLLAES